MRCIILLMLVIDTVHTSAQQNGPWNSPLRIAWSNDGRTFGASEIYQDSAGVPSVARWRGDTFVCAFQWFREPRGTSSWDRVAVKFSYNDGMTWTEPTPIVVRGIPAQYQRPFDPTLVEAGGRLRMYFSSSDGMPMGGLSDIVNTYSAISDDGVTYEFEPGARFDMPNRPVIDPAVIFFRNKWHFSAPIGAPQEGAYHSVSSNGLLFEPRPPYPSDNTHNWTGNFVVVHDTALRFYGSGPSLWYKESADAESWGPFVPTNVMGGDPSVVRTRDGRYVMIYVGPRYPTAVPADGREFVVCVAGQWATVPFDPSNSNYFLYSLQGQCIAHGVVNGNSVDAIVSTQPILLMLQTESASHVALLIP
ncbi:MAG: hypothetical protein FJ211_08880 [Ignavibacteria bacterium]|nr:hypothetical protein [Ignavibacteria bacterium]